MFIYLIKSKLNEKEGYIGKTNNIQSRWYAHLCCIRHSTSDKYKRFQEIGEDNLEIIKIFEYPDTDQTDYETKFIEEYTKNGFNLINKQLNNYHPELHEKNKDRELIWADYKNNLKRRDICDKYNISDSLLTKIIKEHGGTFKKSKLTPFFQEIQDKIISGEPIRRLAEEYGVCKNAIANINKGITAYDPNLKYPLNQFVREEIIKNSYFKSKV